MRLWRVQSRFVKHQASVTSAEHESRSGAGPHLCIQCVPQCTLSPRAMWRDYARLLRLHHLARHDRQLLDEPGNAYMAGI